MTQSLGRLAAGSLLLVVSVVVTFAQEQAPRTAAGCPLADPAKFHACAVEKMQTFKPPQTADGVADFQGYWDRAYTSQDIEEHGADELNTQAGPSIVLDTPDRKIPYQPWAMALKKDMVARYISPLAACLPPGVPRYAIAPGPHEVIQ